MLVIATLLSLMSRTVPGIEQILCNIFRVNDLGHKGIGVKNLAWGLTGYILVLQWPEVKFHFYHLTVFLLFKRRQEDLFAVWL